MATATRISKLESRQKNLQSREILATILGGVSMVSQVKGSENLTHEKQGSSFEEAKKI